MKDDITWGSEVEVLNYDLLQYSGRPCYGSICGITNIDNAFLSETYGVPFGSRVFTVEFDDGSSEEIPEKYLRLINNP